MSCAACDALSACLSACLSICLPTLCGAKMPAILPCPAFILIALHVAGRSAKICVYHCGRRGRDEAVWLPILCSTGSFVIKKRWGLKINQHHDCQCPSWVYKIILAIIILPGSSNLAYKDRWFHDCRAPNDNQQRVSAASLADSRRSAQRSARIVRPVRRRVVEAFSSEGPNHDRMGCVGRNTIFHDRAMCM